jgi:hypothetical protein
MKSVILQMQTGGFGSTLKSAATTLPGLVARRRV